MPHYKVLKENVHSIGVYSIVPIRLEDRYEIMQWRNDQIHNLRQMQILTEQDQDKYYEDVVSKLFGQTEPEQILFSFLKGDACIGYGGLVHINWPSKNAEISFLLKTDLNFEKIYLDLFSVFLSLIEKVAHGLGLHKIYTVGFDTYAYRFIPLIRLNYQLEVTLKEHVRIGEYFFDVLIYSKLLKA